MVEGARLESVFRGNSNVGSNPTLSASNAMISDDILVVNSVYQVRIRLSAVVRGFSAGRPQQKSTK